VLVLEDDATPAHGAVPRLRTLLRQLPDAWEFCYLYTCRPGETPWFRAKRRLLYPVLHRLGSSSHAAATVGVQYSRRYSADLRRAGQHWFALAYGLTHETARRMVEFQTPIRTVADDVTRHMCAATGAQAFLANRNIFVPRSGMDSTIWNRPPLPRRWTAEGTTL
jgi:hypothetical protein